MYMDNGSNSISSDLESLACHCYELFLQLPYISYIFKHSKQNMHTYFLINLQKQSNILELV